MDYLGIGAQVPTNNKIQLRDKGGAVKECNKKIVIFTTKPKQDEFDNWCSYENINPQYTNSAGIFEIPKDQRFYVMGTYQSVQPQQVQKQVQQPQQVQKQTKQVQTPKQ
jgi:hypothetical protein